MRCLYSVKIYVKLYTFVGFEVHSTWFYVIDNQYVTCSGKMEQVVHDKSLILPTVTWNQYTVCIQQCKKVNKTSFD